MGWVERHVLIPGITLVRPGQGAPSTPDDELVQVVGCEGDLADRKFAGLQAHASQPNSLIALVGEASCGASWATEWFRSADAGPAAP